MGHDLLITGGPMASSIRVFTEDGHEINGITSIELEPIRIGELVRARLTFMRVKLALSANSDEANEPKPEHE